MHLNAIPQNNQVVTDIQNQNAPTNIQSVSINVVRLNWKANITCYNWRDKGHLAQECPHTGNANVPQSQPTQLPSHLQANQTYLALLLTTKLKLLQSITAEIPTSPLLLYARMNQLSKTIKTINSLKIAVKQQ